jgi:NADH-quinone oxidoreductase subunit M
MTFIQDNLLTLIVFTPLLGSLLMLLLPRENKPLLRWAAFFFSLIPAALSIWLWFAYQPTAEGFQFEVVAPWFPTINSGYHVGVDGISVAMILLTGILTPLAVLISFSVEDNVRAYMSLFLLLEMGMMGVFVSLDLIIFFIFWEFGLVPMYFLINNWGSANRRYAAFKFFIYTMAGSVGMLLAIQAIGLTSGTFDLLAIAEVWPTLNTGIFGLPITTVKTIAFWAFFIAFAIKVPIWPFHTWLPDAHTEAPTAGSMILAGVLLKLGAYGFLRFIQPLFPNEFQAFAPYIAVLALFAIVLGAYASLAQRDFKRLIAYSSVSHMGMVILGLAVGARALGTDEATRLSGIMATNGAVLQMFNHGLYSAALFALVGMVYERTHTRDLEEYGGLWVALPIYGGMLIFSSMASLGLPGLNGFVSEFLVVRGAWPVFPVITFIGLLGLLLSGAYSLKAIQKVLHGPPNPHWQGLKEVTWREALALAPLMLLMIAIGVWPRWLLDVINLTVTRLIG